MKGLHKQPETAMSVRESKKASADAWKRLFPIAVEINDLRQSGESPFEMEEVIIVD